MVSKASKAKSFGEACRHARISWRSERRALSPVREYLAAISRLSEGHRLGACIDISAYIERQRREERHRNGTEVYEEKLAGKEEDAVPAWRERYIPKAR